MLRFSSHPIQSNLGPRSWAGLTLTLGALLAIPFLRSSNPSQPSSAESLDSLGPKRILPANEIAETARMSSSEESAEKLRSPVQLETLPDWIDQDQFSMNDFMKSKNQPAQGQAADTKSIPLQPLRPWIGGPIPIVAETKQFASALSSESNSPAPVTRRNNSLASSDHSPWQADIGPDPIQPFDRLPSKAASAVALQPKAEKNAIVWPDQRLDSGELHRLVSRDERPSNGSRDAAPAEELPAPIPFLKMVNESASNRPTSLSNAVKDPENAAGNPLPMQPAPVRPQHVAPLSTNPRPESAKRYIYQPGMNP